MLNKKITNSVLALVSLLSFGCSNGINVPITEFPESSDFDIKVAEQQAKKPAKAEKPQPPKMNGEQKPEKAPKPKKDSCSKEPASNNVSVPNNTISSPNSTSNSAKFTVTITGGFETDPRDNGRPVSLIASALGVTSEVFRNAFSLVTPAAGGEEPNSAQVALNKAALLSILGSYGITNSMLDTVSNYYRYNGSSGEVWKRTQATASAIVVNDEITGISITNAGAGYSSTPTISISGVSGVTAKAVVSFTKDLATNGSISSITLTK